MLLALSTVVRLTSYKGSYAADLLALGAWNARDESRDITSCDRWRGRSCGVVPVTAYGAPATTPATGR